MKDQKWLNGTEQAVNTIEIVLILVVLIALVIIFKDVIIGFVQNILQGIQSQSGNFNPATLAK